MGALALEDYPGVLSREAGTIAEVRVACGHPASAFGNYSKRSAWAKPVPRPPGAWQG